MVGFLDLDLGGAGGYAEDLCCRQIGRNHARISTYRRGRFLLRSLANSQRALRLEEWLQKLTRAKV